MLENVDTPNVTTSVYDTEDRRNSVAVTVFRTAQPPMVQLTIPKKNGPFEVVINERDICVFIMEERAYELWDCLNDLRLAGRLV